jgi:predicted aspartyl protease
VAPAVAVTGLFRPPIWVTDLSGGREVEALVGTGATLSQLPAPLARQLGLVGFEKRRFRLAAGRLVWRDVAAGRVFYRNRQTVVDIAIGEPGAEGILGAAALEPLGFVVDPVRRVLVASTLSMLTGARSLVVVRLGVRGGAGAARCGARVRGRRRDVR